MTKTPDDPFLRAHLLSPLRFAICGPISPISIRDQMLRAKMFVDRAFKEKLILPTLPLCVIGAGAAGVTAAMYAVHLEIPTILIEREQDPFSLQMRCTSRWIDPTQYDWPALHWEEETFPWEPLRSAHSLFEPPLPAMPLAWRANTANWVADSWSEDFDKAHNTPGSILNFLPGHTLVGFDEPDPGQMIQVNWGPVQKVGERFVALNVPPQAGKFGALLLASGFAPERTKCEKDSFRSFNFWETDTFEDPNLGLLDNSNPRKRWNVLICGDGDGALQDFLRIATGQKSSADILHRLTDSIDPEILLEIYSAEDQAYRAKAWGSKVSDHASQFRLDLLHRSWATEILSGVEGENARNMLEDLLRFKSRINLELIHPCEHLTAYYPLNRFLVHLIDVYVRHFAPASIVDPANSIQITGGWSVDRVSGVDPTHLCTHPKTCHGVQHEVQLIQTPDCRDWPARGATRPMQLNTADVVILRLGLTLPKALESLPASRHLLPYHPAV